MDIRVSFILLPFLIDCTMGLPLQIYSAKLSTKVPVPQPSKPEVKDVFSIITEANQGSKKLMHEVDIALPIGRSAMICDGDVDSCRWNKTSSGIVNVPYTISTYFNPDGMSTITNAMEDFATLTCVRFIPRTVESDYLNIISDYGCWSYVGKTGGPQEVSLQSDFCLGRGTIQHELNHALGFYHEQSRSDRDNYVDIITANIIPSAIGNFDKLVTKNLGLEYDYSSVMHYGRYAFSLTSNLDTIVPKPNPSVPIGQRYGLSNLDIAKINKLYDCGTCSSLLPNSTGTLMSANYPNTYPMNADCVWLIRAPSDLIFLQFSAFDIQPSPDCASDYLRVYDGANKSSPVLVDRACGTGQLPSLVSSTNMMLLEFVTDNATAATGFKASYSTVKCGSTFTSPTGVFSSPNYPSPYPSSMDCTWIITAPTGYLVSLNITDFYVEQQRTCSYDYLLVFNGPKPTSPQVGKYCGSAAIHNIISEGNSLLVQFHSDNSVQTKGFMAKYAVVPQK